MRGRVDAAWDLLPEEAPLPGWRNMALDQALLDLADREGRSFVRLYRWEPFCISFGRHEPAAALYDRGRVERLALDVVRRPTGGRAVWHGRHLTYAVAAPRERFGTLPRAYRAIHAMLARAVAALGGEPRLAPDPARALPVGHGPCFAAPAGGEVIVGGEKVVGSAQVRRRGAFLQHGVLLLEEGQEMLDRVSRAGGPAGGRPLAAILGRPLGFEEAAGAVLRALGEWPGGVRRADAEEVSRAAAPHEARFRSAEWTWGPGG